MKIYLILCLLISCGNLFAQERFNNYGYRVHTFDYFDIMDIKSHYELYYEELQNERLNGKVKEIKRISWDKDIHLHFKLNKKGEIIQNISYVDGRITRDVTYSKRRTIMEIRYYPDGTKGYTIYKYDKLDKLISYSYSEDKPSKKPVLVTKFSYDGKGRLVLRKHGSGSEDKFEYEGDSVAWRFSSDDNGVLQHAARRLRRKGYELTSIYKPNKALTGNFKNRLILRNEYVRRWDDNRNVTEFLEHDYDSVGNLAYNTIHRYTYKDNLLIKTYALYNEKLLKGEVLKEYSYTDDGKLISKKTVRGKSVEIDEYIYNEHGDIVSSQGFINRYRYDKQGNWIRREMYVSRKSSYDRKSYEEEIKNINEDDWVINGRREILYY
ncbi:hypothetical protein D770_05180 [Flammeovirgaceae bacterium 311]|nr:hypothetical protein D770_05180 [Flammeovirgaceae bacterium 311]